MIEFFAKNYHGAPFQFMGFAHLAALFVLVLLNLALARTKTASEATRRRIRWLMAIILWVNEIGWHLWNYTTGQWDIQTMLPLHVCSILVWLGGWMLVTKNYRIYEFTYFLGIGGALQALLTPDLGIYGYPHYRFFQTFISHGLIVTSAVYLTVAEGFRPTWKSILRVAIGGNIYMAVVFVINLLIGSNYMYVNHKPLTASIMDMLPAWPVYLLYLEAIGLVTFLILYLPFMIKDLRDKYVQKRDGNIRLDSVTK
jgi:hypothetical integral membrane protein (TIGR02206 family)